MSALESDALKLILGPGISAEQSDAQEFLRKRGLHAGSVSTLQKVMRASRIALGERARVKRRCKRTIIVGRRQPEIMLVLHPTKGWKRA